MTDPVIQFKCGLPTDHDCDDNGPVIYGGDDVETTTDQSKAGKGYTWGSVTCSICGLDSMSRSYWRDDE